MFINFISNIWYKIKIQYNIIKIRHVQSQFNTQIMTPAAGGVSHPNLLLTRKCLERILFHSYNKLHKNFYKLNYSHTQLKLNIPLKDGDI